MKFSRIIKTVLLLDFLSGMLMAVKEIFKTKKTINTHLRKEKSAQDLEVNMR